MPYWTRVDHSPDYTSQWDSVSRRKAQLRGTRRDVGCIIKMDPYCTPCPGKSCAHVPVSTERSSGRTFVQEPVPRGTDPLWGAFGGWTGWEFEPGADPQMCLWSPSEGAVKAAESIGVLQAFWGHPGSQVWDEQRSWGPGHLEAACYLRDTSLWLGAYSWITCWKVLPVYALPTFIRKVAGKGEMPAFSVGCRRPAPPRPFLSSLSSLRAVTVSAQSRVSWQLLRSLRALCVPDG